MAISEYLDSMDFYTLRKLMLDMAPDDVDKSEGSFMYDAVTPIALFVSEMMSQMKLVLEQSFIGTANGSNLDTLAATMPRIYRRPALSEKLILRLSPNTDAIRYYILNNSSSLQFSNYSGEMFKLDTEQSDWLESDSANIYVRVYKDALGKGSSVVGQAMEPSPAISGLEVCVIHSITSGGSDAEDDDHFRVRVWASMSSPFLGSVADYQRKIFSEFPLSENGFNVENCFIIPRGSRSGYICIIPAKKGDDGSAVHCEAGELNSLRDYLDKRIDGIGGYGMGVAPIGHVVKVRDFSEFRLHQRVTVVVARGRINEVNTETVRSQVTTATNNYLRSIIDEVIPSATNYMADSRRYVNFFIYYYVNAHEYAVLSTLRDSFGTDLIKNATIERSKFVGHSTDSYLVKKVNGQDVTLSAGSTDVINLYINGEMIEEDNGWKLSELSLQTSLIQNITTYVALEWLNGRLVIRPNGTYDGTNVVLSDLTLIRDYDNYEISPQEDLVIKSGDSKGTLPVLGSLNVEIVEAEG